MWQSNQIDIVIADYTNVFLKSSARSRLEHSLFGYDSPFCIIFLLYYRCLINNIVLTYYNILRNPQSGLKRSTFSQAAQNKINSSFVFSLDKMCRQQVTNRTVHFFRLRFSVPILFYINTCRLFDHRAQTRKFQVL